MQEQIKKLHELAEKALTESNVFAVHEMLGKMLVIIEELSTEKAENICRYTDLGPLCVEDTLPEAP